MNRPLPLSLVRALAIVARLSLVLVNAAVTTLLVLLLFEKFPLLLGDEAFLWSVENLGWTVGICALVGITTAVTADRLFLRRWLSPRPSQ